MIYVADGPSDVPVFSIVESNGGRTYAVYRPGSHHEFQQAARLLEQGRVDAFGEADYSDGSHTAMWLMHAAEEIASRTSTTAKTPSTNGWACPQPTSTADRAPS